METYAPRQTRLEYLHQLAGHYRSTGAELHLTVTLNEIAGLDASLSCGHVWTNVRCPAYRSYDPTECECAR